MSDELDLFTLRQWLVAAVVGGVPDRLPARLVAGRRSNPTYEITDGTRSGVLRQPPHGHVLPTAHDMGREHRVLHALQNTAVPVPRVGGLCHDKDVIGASFSTMDRLDGITLRTQQDTARQTPEQRARFADAMVHTLVAVHKVDPAGVGLGD